MSTVERPHLLHPTPADPLNTAPPPTCAPGCKWMQRFGFDLQLNALRMETIHMVQGERCGWNLLPGRLGGHPLDYAPCINPALAAQQQGGA